MDPPQINYVDPLSIMVINPVGKMRQLFVPFKAQVIEQTVNLSINTWVYVEEVKSDHKYKLLFRVGDSWWPYYAFRIVIHF